MPTAHIEHYNRRSQGRASNEQNQGTDAWRRFRVVNNFDVKKKNLLLFCLMVNLIQNQAIFFCFYLFGVYYHSKEACLQIPKFLQNCGCQPTQSEVAQTHVKNSKGFIQLAQSLETYMHIKKKLDGSPTIELVASQTIYPLSGMPPTVTKPAKTPQCTD